MHLKAKLLAQHQELLVQHSASLLLPPQLRLLLPHHHGDSTTTPLAVQMNHVFCHVNDDYCIFAMAHRYKDRSVTQYLYKPTRKSVPAADAAILHDNPSLLRTQTKNVVLQSVRISGSHIKREQGHEYVTYVVDSSLSVHGVQTTLRSERRYKHFGLLHQLLCKEFGPLVSHLVLPSKRFLNNLHPSFIEERRVALEKYLQQCIMIPSVSSSSVFCNFVEADVPCNVDLVRFPSFLLFVQSLLVVLVPNPAPILAPISSITPPQSLVSYLPLAPAPAVPLPAPAPGMALATAWAQARARAWAWSRARAGAQARSWARAWARARRA